MALLVALVACKDKPAPVIAHESIEVFTDESARTIPLDHALALRDVVTPPIASWIAVTAETQDGRSIEIASPAKAYPTDEIRLYLEGGKPAIGLFPPVTPDMPPEVARRASQPIASLTPITSVHVATHLAALPALTVRVDGKDVPIASDALRGLHEISGARAVGWRLSEVVALATDRVGAIRVLGAQEVTLSADEVAKAVLKANQRGEYVVRVWDEGANTPTREVRGVTKIVVGGS